MMLARQSEAEPLATGHLWCVVSDSNLHFVPDPRDTAGLLAPFIPEALRPRSTARAMEELLGNDVVHVFSRGLSLRRDTWEQVRNLSRAAHPRPMALVLLVGQNDAHSWASTTRVLDQDRTDSFRDWLERRLTDLYRMATVLHLPVALLSPFDDEPQHFSDEYVRLTTVLREVLVAHGAHQLTRVGTFLEDRYHLDSGGRELLARQVAHWLRHECRPGLPRRRRGLLSFITDWTHERRERAEGLDTTGTDD